MLLLPILVDKATQKLPWWSLTIALVATKVPLTEPFVLILTHKMCDFL